MKKSTFIAIVSIWMVISLITISLLSCSNELEVCRVSFDSQGGSEVATVEVAKGLKAGEPKSPVRDGYMFVGWYKEIECINGWDFCSDVVNSHITLYAKWTADSYPVVYNANGATDGSVPSPQSKIHGVDLNLALNTGGLGRSGYWFDGWNTQPDGSGSDYAAGGLYAIDSAVMLYAKWSLQYTVNFNANGATEGSVPAPQSKYYGIDLSLATNTGELAREGYSFSGWNTLPDGSGINYAAGSIYSTDSSLILYARWVVNNYLVTYDANEASVGTVPSPQSKVYGIDLTLASNSGGLIRNGYTFRGWNTQPDGSGIEYLPGSLYSIDSSVVLYAHWIPQYTVTFDEQGGTNLSMTDKTVTPGQEYGSLATVEKSGYAFSGWWTGINGTGDKILETTIVSITANLTLYAHWIPQYTVTFNAQGGTNLNPTTKTVMYGFPYGDLASTIKLGYKLCGWTTAPDGKGTLISSDSNVSEASDHVLYANWILGTQKITFDVQGGTSPSITSKVVTYGSNYGELAFTSRENHIFSGWWTGEGGTGSLVTESTVFTGTTDRTLYAKWIFDVFTGPAGGLVFYENLNYEQDGWHYLEVAPYGWYEGATDSNGAYYGEDDPAFQWGAFLYSIDPPATFTAVGSGVLNTTNIVSYHDTLWTIYPAKGSFYTDPMEYSEYNDGTVAAKVCEDYSREFGGEIFSDWFLPSINELNLIYQNMYLQRVGNFCENWYWSSSDSSEDNGRYARTQEFGSGNQGDGTRYSSLRVRPIRAF